MDKFLYRVDRDESELKSYMENPVAYVANWEKEEGPWLNKAERTSCHSFTEEERRALAQRDFEKLYALGAHPFILWTMMMPVCCP